VHHVVAWQRIFCLRIVDAMFQKFVGVSVARQHSLNIHKFPVYHLVGTGNVCNMPFVSFALAVIFVIRLFSISAFRVPKLPHRIVQKRPDFLQPQDRSQPLLQLQKIKVNSFSGAGSWHILDTHPSCPSPNFVHEAACTITHN